jgi:hypothetical protein
LVVAGEPSGTPTIYTDVIRYLPGSNIGTPGTATFSSIG